MMSSWRLTAFYLFIAHLTGLSIVKCQDYQGAFLGKLNTYAHQVTGEVYAINEYTFLIKNFFFDGLGQDTFFWAGSTVRPSNIGFIVPDDTGRTNKLQRYVNQDITIKLPDDKKIKTLKWLAIWDIRDNRNFADIYIPEGFEPPSPQKVSEFNRDSNGIKSGPVVIVNSKTVKIPDFFYDGLSSSAHFYAGTGPQPNPNGKIIPDELGYIEPLGKYDGETISLDLPGEMTVFEIDWISIWDIENDISFGYISMPDGLNIPPSLAVIMKKETRLPNCEQLHRDVQVAWEIFGPQITFEMSVQMADNEYVAFGLSGSSNSSKMIGSDVAISWLEGHLGHTVDYNITDYYPCTNVLGYWRGVCPDIKMGGIDNFQIHTFFREDGITRLTFRRNLLNNDEGDKMFDKDLKNSYIVWAVGSLNEQKEPRYHRLYPRRDVKLHFGRKPEKKCYSFIRTPESVSKESTQLKAWGPLRIVNQTLTNFYARLGVPGGQRGFIGSTGKSSPGLVWYINGLMAPVLYVKRGRSYVFRVEGGNNPNNAYAYHPLYITNDPSGGYVKLTEAERKKHVVYAGVEFDKKGRPSPTTAGRLCLWSYSTESDPRKADKFASFTQFRSSLNYTCDLRGSASLLQWTPTASTPDIVYYQSYTQRNMGWRIVVLDDFSTTSQVGSSSLGSGSTPINGSIPSLLLLATISVYFYTSRHSSY